MRSASLRMFFRCVLVLAPLYAHGQLLNLSDHVFWDATGTRENQVWGFAGLDTIGRVNDSIPFAVAIGEHDLNAVSAFVYNRFKLDTVRHFEFPGRDVVKGFFNSDSLADFLCLDPVARVVRILFGTNRVDSFSLATSFQLHTQGVYGSALTNTMCVYDFDSDGHSDVIFANYGAMPDSSGGTRGGLFYLRGGDTFDTLPAQTLFGTKPYSDYVGGALMVGRFGRDSRLSLAEARVYGPQASSGFYDTMKVFFYPIGPGFRLIPQDTLILVFDSTGKKTILDRTHVWAANVDDDNGSEILVGGGAEVYAFRTDSTSVRTPFITFRRPFTTNSTTFGSKVIDVGTVASDKYHSLLVTDPEAQTAGYFNGAVFLFNVGKGIRDSCVAWYAPAGFEEYFGTHAIAGGDVNNDGRADFFVARDEEILPAPAHVGGLTLFLGSDAYATPLSVHESASPILMITLSQNYPNPASSTTDITFAVSDTRLSGKSVRVKLYDLLGREVTTVYRGSVDHYGYTIRVNTAPLPSGEYEYRLECGGKYVNKIMSIVH